MKRSIHLIFMVLVTLVFLSGSALAVKPKVTNTNLEINDLKTEGTLKTLEGTIGKVSKVKKYLYNPNFGPMSGTAEEMARNYLALESGMFGLEGRVQDLQLVQVAKSPGGNHVRLRPTVQGIPVYASDIVVTINKNNMISFVASANRPGLQLQSTTASISGSRALQIAKDYLNIEGRIIGDPKSDLMVFESKTRGAVLAYRTVTTAENPMGDWEVFVDAISGEVIHVRDQANYRNKKANGQGLVWEPDPLTTAGVLYGGVYVDNSDQDVTELNAERVSVVLQDITYTGSVYKLEGPYCKLADLESPSDNFPELADSSAFNFTRSQQNFEDVMVYYHIDKSYRWLDYLGFDMPGLYQFKADPHGLSGDDNSHYVPSSNYCAWGEGGVDDSEDADVIWHEYAHAIQTNAAGGMSYSGETQSLQEGSSDYWAVSYSREEEEFGWQRVFTWDGHNPFWPGRLADLEWIYPDDYVSGHNGGQLWSSVLMKIWEELGREVTDKLFIQSHYIWGYSPSLPDAAAAFIQADRDLYSGSHLSTIVNWFDARGLVDAANYIPQITHTPLPDTEDPNGPYEVIVEIAPGTAALDTSQLEVVYGYAALTDTVKLTATGNTNEYVAYIPGPGMQTEIQYYISVVDSASNYVVLPAGAPANYYAFNVGPDMIAPEITHSALRNQAYIRWPASVRAYVTDNIGVADVQVLYYINSPATNGTFSLTDDGNGNYSGTFDVDTNSVSIGDSVFYRITASDVSISGNITNDPASGYHSFEIIETRGIVLIVNDDVSKTTKVIGPKGSYDRNKASLGAAANNMSRWLNSLGFISDVVSVSEAMSLNWDDYSLIIHSSGGNESPLSDAAYRTKFETYAANPEHKYIIEGGEVGYDVASSPGYPSFTNVIHSDDWDGDNSGALNLRAGYEAHPLATIPNILPSSLAINYDGWGDQDSQKNMPDAFVVFGTTDEPNNAGILVYDDNPNPQSAQMVYFAFNFGVMSDSTAAKYLIENTAEFLLTPENTAIGSISGTVNLSDTTDNSGVKVVLSGLDSDTTMTDSLGYYEFTDLYNGTYAVTASKGGYFPYAATIDEIEVDNNAVTGIDFTLDPVLDGMVSGTVTLVNAATNDSVEVEIVGQGLTAFTDAAGAYSFNNVAPGELHISFTKQGFVPVIVDTVLENGGSLTIDATLGRDLAAPSALQAISGYDGVVPLNWLPPGTLNEDFEDGIPVDWNILNLGDNSSAEGWELTTVNVHSGAQAIRCMDGAVDEYMNEWVITNKVNISAANPILNFWHLATSLSYDNAPNYIRVSTTSNSDTSQFEVVKTYPAGALPTVWTLDAVDLSAYIGQSVYIAFQYTSTWGEFWYVDDVSLNSVSKSIADEKIVVHQDDKNEDNRISSTLIQKSYNSSFGKANKNLSEYHVFRSTNSGVMVEPGNLVGMVGDSVFNYDDTTVVNGTTYFYVVAGYYGADGYSPASNEVSATPEGLMPPTNVQITDSTNYIAISWNDVLEKYLAINKRTAEIKTTHAGTELTGADWFNVYKSTDGTNFSMLTDSVMASAYSDYDVAVGNMYWYYVTAVVGGQESDPSDVVSATVVAGDTEMELVYDDGDAESGYYWDVEGTGSGNRMTPPTYVKILKAKFYMRTPNAGANTFTAKIYDYDMNNNQPGAELASVQVINAANDNWAEVDFSTFDIWTDHDFIVFMEYDNSNQPVFGFDLDDNGRAWDYDASAGGWGSWNETYFMRAVVGLVSGIEKELGVVPQTYALEQNFPNPFNPETTIKYQLPKASNVKLEIFNMLGQKIKTLVNDRQEANFYSVKWNGLTESGERAASGVYLYRLEAGNFVKSQKMLFLK